MLRNRTSEVPADRSVAYIERRLVGQKAKHIMKQYGPTGMLESLCFTIEVNGRAVPFKVPANVPAVLTVMEAAVRRPRDGTMKRLREQAERTAWKLMADWVDVQLSLIEIGRRDVMEVFLSYVYDPVKTQTFYEKIKEEKFKLLPHGDGGSDVD